MQGGLGWGAKKALSDHEFARLGSRPFSKKLKHAHDTCCPLVRESVAGHNVKCFGHNGAADFWMQVDLLGAERASTSASECDY